MSVKFEPDVVFVPSSIMYKSPASVVVPVQDSAVVPELVEDSCGVTNASE